VSTISPIGREPGRRIRQASPSRGRDRARTRALALLLALALVSTLTVWLIVRSEAKDKTPATSPCTATNGSLSTVRLRVLNATPREGLAGSVADELRKRGYTVTGVGNDSRHVPAPAEIRHGNAGAPAARVVAGIVAGAITRNDARAGSEVDLVLGTRFRVLAPAKPGAAGIGCLTTGSPRRR